MRLKFLILFGAAVLTLITACGGKSDKELQTSADTALKSDLTTANVVVAVKDGVATITGEVADNGAKAKAAELAKVEGVNLVKNDVAVAPAPPPSSSENDPTLKTKIEEALKAKDCQNIGVVVKDGVAIVSGTIPQAKYAECVMAVQETSPKDWENLLKFEE